MTVPGGAHDHRRLGVIVVGTGFGCFTHVRALRAAGFEVVAVVGRHADRTAERARLFEVPRACTSLAEAVAETESVAVTIATPPLTHAELAVEAMAAGKHVLCEKPFAADTAEARVVLAAAHDAGVVHVMGTEFRYDAGQARLARAVADGTVGEPRIATWLMHVPVLVEADAQVPDWWADATTSGGWLAAHGSQLIDQIRATLGEFGGVSASLVHVVDRPMTADDGFVVHFRMASGCVGTLQSTASDRGIMVETRVTGSAGTAWIEGVGATVKVASDAGVRTLPAWESMPNLPAPVLPAGSVSTTYERMITFGVEYGPFTRLAAAFRDLILGRPAPDPPPATFADGVAMMTVLDAIRRSAAAGGAWTATDTADGNAADGNAPDRT